MINNKKAVGKGVMKKESLNTKEVAIVYRNQRFLNAFALFKRGFSDPPLNYYKQSTF